MNHRAEYLLQVLERIGTPLLASVVETGARGGGTPLQQEAQKIAELLAKSVQTGIEIGNILDLGPTGGITDPLRLALTGLASGFVGTSYRSNGKTPGEADIKRMVSALQAVLTFSDNFMADSETADRLRNIPAEGQGSDIAQTHVQYLHAFIPVVGAIAAFPFGQPEQKLIMEVSGRLVQESASLRQAAFGDNGKDNKRIELGILAALARIYAASHESETERIMNLSDEERSQLPLSLEPVWKNFALRVAMLETLAKGILGSSGLAAAGNEAVKPPLPPPPQRPPVQKTPLPASPPTGSPLGTFAKKPSGEAPPADPRQPFHSQSSPQQGTSPMSFFKGPPKENGES